MSDLPPEAKPLEPISDNDKLMAALSYLLTPLVPAIVLLTAEMKARPYQRYHAIQALGMLAGLIVVTLFICVVYTVLSAVSFGLLGLCLWVLFLLPAVPPIYYAIVAYTTPRYFTIPVVTDFMVSQGWLQRM